MLLCVCIYLWPARGLFFAGECASSKTSASEGKSLVSSPSLQILGGRGVWHRAVCGMPLQAWAQGWGIRNHEMVVGGAPPCYVDIFYKTCCAWPFPVLSNRKEDLKSGMFCRVSSLICSCVLMVRLTPGSETFVLSNLSRCRTFCLCPWPILARTHPAQVWGILFLFLLDNLLSWLLWAFWMIKLLKVLMRLRLLLQMSAQYAIKIVLSLKDFILERLL